MGFLKKAVKVARVVSNTDIGVGTTTCEGCGKSMSARKSNVCSKRCADFLGHHQYGGR